MSLITYPPRLAKKVHIKTRDALYSLLTFCYGEYWKCRQKTISAKIRVRNGAEFLEASVLSIVPIVDEIVIVDNRSCDGTQGVIAKLARSLEKIVPVRSYSYDHDVVTVGEETTALYQTDPTSPRLTCNYYNWCLRKCRCAFVLKWDDDMIATEHLLNEIQSFKKSRFLKMDFGGTNVTPKMECLSWDAGSETRIFPRWGARYVFANYDFLPGGRWGGQSLKTWVAPWGGMICNVPLYAHMKYCKQNPGSNQSSIFKQVLENRIRISGPAPQIIKDAILKFKVLSTELKL